MHRKGIGGWGSSSPVSVALSGWISAPNWLGELFARKRHPERVVSFRIASKAVLSDRTSGVSSVQSERISHQPSAINVFTKA
jgi:hypothetical protein